MPLRSLLERLGAKQASTAAIKFSRNLSAKVGRTSGYRFSSDQAKPLSELSAHDYMAAMYTLGIASTTSALDDVSLKSGRSTYRNGPNTKALSFQQIIEMLPAADELLAAWPDRFNILLSEIEARNGLANSSTLAGAFATSVDRLLASPILGSDQKPLRFLVEAVDQYWTAKSGGRTTVKRPSIRRTAEERRLYSSMNVSTISRNLGFKQPNSRVRRTFREIIENLTIEQRSLPNDDLSRHINQCMQLKCSKAFPNSWRHDVVAVRLKHIVNTEKLSRELGLKASTPTVDRLLREAFRDLTDEQRALGEEELGAIVREIVAREYAKVKGRDLGSVTAKRLRLILKSETIAVHLGLKKLTPVAKRVYSEAVEKVDVEKVCRSDDELIKYVLDATLSFFISAKKRR